MNKEEEIVSQLESLEKVGKNAHGQNYAALAIDILEKSKEDYLPPKLRNWSYVISLALPPLGIGFGIYFLMLKKKDSGRAAAICCFLTIMALVITWITISAMLRSANIIPQQIQGIDLNEVRDLTQ